MDPKFAVINALEGIRESVQALQNRLRDLEMLVLDQWVDEAAADALADAPLTHDFAPPPDGVARHDEPPSHAA